MRPGPIEPLDLTDHGLAAQVHALQRSAYRREADLIGFEGIPPLHESLAEMRAQPLEWLGIAAEGRLVAAMGISSRGRRCDIDRLVVDPAWHRRGLGRRLVQAVLHHESVTVSTGTANAPARALYESLGFRRLGEHEVAPGITVTEYEHWHDCFRTSFDVDATGYEAARPGYPAELFGLLVERCGLTLGTRVLEVGPGTGQATVPLLDLGAEVVAVEPGPNMAARLRERVAGRPCAVVESDLESAELPAGAFDLAVSATAFHWVDSAVGIPLVARALVPGGWLALWWNVFRDRRSDDPISVEIERIASRFQTAGRSVPVSHALAVDARVDEITAGGHFGLVEHRRIPFEIVHTPESLRALHASFSTWVTTPEPDRSRALDDVAAIVARQPNGTLRRTYTTAVYLARRTDRPLP